MTATTLRPPRLLTLVLLSALSIVSLNMFLPSLGNIAKEFEVDYALVNVSIAGYLAVTAIVQLTIGPLSDRYGRRPVVLINLAVFSAASVGCLLATDITAFLICRMLQAGIASGHAISLAIVRDTHEPERAAGLIGDMATAWAIAPMLGPVLGGYLDEHYGWRASFWMFAILGASVFTLCWFDLRETNKQRSTSMLAQLRAYPDLFCSRRFWGYAVCMAFSVGAFFIYLTGAPIVARHVFGLSTSTVGIVLGLITVGFIAGTILSGRMAGKIPLIAMIICGRVVACVGLSAGLVLIFLGVVTEVTYFASCMFVGLGNGLTMPSANAGILSVRPHLAGTAAGLSAALLVAGAALLSALAGMLVTAENAAPALLALMLASSAVGLVAAALCVVRQSTGSAPYATGGALKV